MEFNFKKNTLEAKRKIQCHQLLIKNPNSIPVILEKDPRSIIQEIKKSKFLVSKEVTVNQFILLIRGLIQISENEGIFFVVKGKYTISGDKTMEQIYNNYKDKDDGFLYIAYSSELIYG